MRSRRLLFACCLVSAVSANVRAGESWEKTPESEAALEAGLGWLARQQGPEGNWGTDNSGLVGMGALAFLSAGQMPGRGEQGRSAQRAIDWMLKHVQPSGLLSHAEPEREMFSHGRSTFVLGQAHGMSDDARIGPVLDRALRLILAAQSDDGGWSFQARRQSEGSGLAHIATQAQALRSALDCGLDVPAGAVEAALQNVLARYRGPEGIDPADPSIRDKPGQFVDSAGENSLRSAAAGVVALFQLGRADDWRIGKNMDAILAALNRPAPPADRGQAPLEAETLYYVGQALRLAGGKHWKEGYPILRDSLVTAQFRRPGDPHDGHWRDPAADAADAQLAASAAACIVLSLPHRYVPGLEPPDRARQD